jgi:hypothetical protein
MKIFKVVNSTTLLIFNFVKLKIDSAIWHDSHLNLKGQIILYREIVDKGGLLMRDPLKLISPTSDFHLIKLLKQSMFMTSLI